MSVIFASRRRRKWASIAASEMLVDSAGVKELCIVYGRILRCNSGNEEGVRSNGVRVQNLDLANSQRNCGVGQGKISGSPDLKRQMIPIDHCVFMVNAQFIGGRVIAGRDV